MIRKTIAFAAGMLVLPVFALSAQTRGGLTKVELLALQQEMRDQGCGNQHAAAEWDAATKKAIRTCAKKYNTSTNAKELLAAMNIGFSAGDTPPAAPAAKGDDMGGMKMEGMKMSEEGKESPGAEKAAMKRAPMKMTGEMKMKHDSMMKAGMKMKPGMKMTGEMKMKHDSMMKSDSTKKN
jgi:hypothetical protein